MKRPVRAGNPHVCHRLSFTAPGQSLGVFILGNVQKRQRLQVIVWRSEVGTEVTESIHRHGSLNGYVC